MDKPALCFESIFEDHRGELRFDTNGGDLNRLNPHTEIFKHYLVKDGLPNNVVYGAREDEDGILRVSTNHGLSRFDPHEETLRNYDAGDGLKSNEFNSGVLWRSDNGETFFGGLNGVTSFFPRRITDNKAAPAMVITDFKVFNRSMGTGDTIDNRVLFPNAVNESPGVTLNYNQSIFTIECAGLHYTSPERNRYAYKMKPLEREWNEGGNRRFATFSHLPPGKYVFRVKGVNSNGIWNREGIALGVTIIPPPLFMTYAN